MYINTEMTKIYKMKQNILFTILIAVGSILLCILFNIIAPAAAYKFYFRAFSVFTYMPAFIAPILFTNILFASEYQNRTLTYIVIRPIESRRLFMSKIMAAFIGSGIIVLIVGILIFIYTILLMGRLHYGLDVGSGYTVIRCISYMLYTVLGMGIAISIACIISILMKNVTISFIVSLILILLFNMANAKFNINGEIHRFPLSTFLNPASYYQKSFSEYMEILGTATVVNLIVIIILLFIGSTMFKKSRKI